MANKVLLKKSSVVSRIPTTSDLDYGELALNYADGKLYYKTSGNTIDSYPSATATATLTNKTLTSPVISGGTINDAIIGGTTPAAITGSSVTSTGNLLSTYSAGDEGGEIFLAKPQTNTSITSGVRIDVYQNKLRIWEDGGTNRGAYIDLTAAGAGVGTNLIATAGVGTVTSITAGTGLTGGTITSSGTIAIDSTVATLTGSQTLTNKTLTFPVINNIKEGYTSTATAAGTTTLTSSSNHYQRFTGSTTQTIVLPVTSTLATGVSYVIENSSTGNLTVNSSGGNLVITIIPGVTVQCMCIGTALTTAADWDPEYTEFAAITGTGSAVLSASPALTGTTTFANATSATGFLAVGTSSVTTNKIYATNGAGAASILGNNTFQTTSGLAGVSGTTTSAGSGHLGYFNGTVRSGVFGQIGTYSDGSTNYAGYFDGRVAVTGALTVTGDLTVNGTTTTVNSTTLTVDDKNIELGSTASPTDVTADGGGITLKGATDKTFNWVNATDAWTSSEHIALAAGKTLVVGGSSSGTTTITAAATASGILTLPAATDTLVGQATTDTLTNKTLSAAVLSGTLTAGGGVGTNGQVLQSTGTGVQWATVSGGGGGYSDLVEISQTGISTSTTLYSASATTYRGAKYTIQITNSTAYAMYEFVVMHDGTGIYFPYSSSAYAGDTGGNYQNYFHGDYLDSIAVTKIQVGNTYHALNWAVTSGNLVFSASCSSGTISVKGAVLLIKA